MCVFNSAGTAKPVPMVTTTTTTAQPTRNPTMATTKALGRCYLVETKANWLDAAQNCQRNGAQLAVVRSDSKNNIVANKCTGSEQCWIGIRSLGDSEDAKLRTYQGVDGAVVRFSSWAAGEPNNRAGNQDCISINYGGFGNWDDDWCTTER